MQPLQICIGPTIRIGRESWCLPYAGFFHIILYNYAVVKASAIIGISGYQEPGCFNIHEQDRNTTHCKHSIIKKISISFKEKNP